MTNEWVHFIAIKQTCSIEDTTTEKKLKEKKSCCV